MNTAKPSLLIVDDEIAIRQTLSAVLAESGYQVRSAGDGFSGLEEMRGGVPDIILSDLNMPRMSGFEFLSVVRRRFPEVRVVAMSGAYRGDAVPAGIAADAFYEKGTGLAVLLRIMETVSDGGRVRLPYPHNPLAPIWIPGNGHNVSGEPFVIITCAECLRTFAHVLDEADSSIQETPCVYCRSVIHFAIVQPALSASSETDALRLRTRAVSPLGVPNFY